ncbi:MAG: MFS transporter, partial [Actinomycetes bacterium]
LIGIGVGVCFPALMTLAMSGATAHDAGLASGLVNTSAEVGAADGLAVLATLSAARTEDLLGRGLPPLQALTEGYHAGFWAAAVLIVLALLVAAGVLRPDRVSTR